MKSVSNITLTENGAITYSGSGSYVLDLFSTIGALRGREYADIKKRLDQAWAESPDLTMKILFYARDIRGGLGERQVFRFALFWLAVNHKGSLLKNMEYIPEFGRFDDLLILLNSPCRDEVIEFIRKTLENDIKALKAGEPVSLLGKWLPSINTSNRYARIRAKIIAKALGMQYADYRKLLSALRARIVIIENKLRERDYSFDYGTIPSNALYRYRQAFIRNDNERYMGYLRKVSEGKANMHSGTITPYDVILPLFRRYLSGYYHNISDCSNMSEQYEEIEHVADVTWKSLKDFTGSDNALAVIDGSGSMYVGKPLPAAVALSLGIYFAERNTGSFHGHFITFSENPRLIKIKGGTIADRVRYCASFDEVADTNIQRVFELILKAALKSKAPEEELPSTLYFITDMEFNKCTVDAELTNFEYAKLLYERHGYRLPKVVFWNVDSRNIQQPVTMNEKNVVLVSGYTPRIFEMILNFSDSDADEFTPYKYMLNTLKGERYKDIKA